VNRNGVIALGIAVVIGLVGVYLLNIVITGFEGRASANGQEGEAGMVVVARSEIPFGATITSANTRVMAWPLAATPRGVFHSLADLGPNRVALQTIAPDEPLLESHISGRNARPTLSVALAPGMLAVSIPVNDVTGVGGFVRPGDMVDVLLTRQMPGENAGAADKMTDVVMQAVRVLAIDQVADPGKTDPAVAKTATLEVDQTGAQKLSLARELGSMSLALRKLGNIAAGRPSTITPRDISAMPIRIVAPPAPRQSIPIQVPPAAGPALGPTVTIYRQAKSTDYEVPYAF